MASIDFLKETWVIGVLAGVGALIVILIVVIIVLCCLWQRKKKKEREGEPTHHVTEKELNTIPERPGRTSGSSYQEASGTQNWLLAQNGVNSTPASSDLSRVIKGDDPFVAGSSMVKMNEEMRRNGVQSSQQSKTIIEQSLEQNHNVDAFERKRSRANDERTRRSVVSSPSRYDEKRDSTGAYQVSSYQKPKLSNVHVSSSKYYASAERPSNERTYTQDTRSTPAQTNLPYRIPQEDYSNQEIVMYRHEEQSNWNNASTTRQKEVELDGKVKNIAAAFEPTENPPNSPERREYSEERRYRKTSAQEPNAAVRRTPSKNLHTQQEFSRPAPATIQEDYQVPAQHPSTNWQGKSGKGTIETRVNRIKKLGAISVFPD